MTASGFLSTSFDGSCLHFNVSPIDGFYIFIYIGMVSSGRRIVFKRNLILFNVNKNVDLIHFFCSHIWVMNCTIWWTFIVQSIYTKTTSSSVLVWFRGPENCLNSKFEFCTLECFKLIVLLLVLESILYWTFLMELFQNIVLFIIDKPLTNPTTRYRYKKMLYSWNYERYWKPFQMAETSNFLAPGVSNNWRWEYCKWFWVFVYELSGCRYEFRCCHVHKFTYQYWKGCEYTYYLILQCQRQQM